MFLVGIISWWYGRGWRGQFSRAYGALAGTAGFFSIGQLVMTLFSPFRQISAGSASGSPVVMLRAFFDQTISRIIGAIVRLFTILAGVTILVIQGIYQLVMLVAWPLLPLFPVVGLILMVIGWVPE